MLTFMDKVVFFTKGWTYLSEEDVGHVGMSDCKVFLVQSKKGYGIVTKYSTWGNFFHMPLFNEDAEIYTKIINSTLARMKELQQAS